jgi:hypothetical protein
LSFYPGGPAQQTNQALLTRRFQPYNIRNPIRKDALTQVQKDTGRRPTHPWHVKPKQNNYRREAVAL